MGGLREEIWWEWEWRMIARDGGVEMGGGDDSEAGTVTKKKGKKSTTSLTLDSRDKEEKKN